MLMMRWKARRQKGRQTGLQTPGGASTGDEADSADAAENIQPQNTPTLWFSPTAWAKLLYLRDRGPTEVGAFGICPADNLLRIEDVQLVRQFCTSLSRYMARGAENSRGNLSSVLSPPPASRKAELTASLSS